MNKKDFYDITEVCKLLRTTSRTLRFYEEKGIITSTTQGLSLRRQYTKEQFTQIRNVLVLRKLGLSIKEIAALQAEQSDLRDAVLSKRAEIYASIHAHIREIHFLNEALSALEAGKNIFEDTVPVSPQVKAEELEIVQICTGAILNHKDALLYKYLSPRLIQYMPVDVYRTVRQDIFTPLGAFIALDTIVTDEQYPNKVYSKVRFEKLGLMITFVLYNGQIDGLWLGYYN